MITLKQKPLNPKQEKFANLYATDKEFFGNGVQSYIEAYDPDTSKSTWYKTACISASQLLSNIRVCTRITQLLEEGGLNDQHVDKQLLFIITQFDDKSTKLAAIREYNKLKQRINEKTDVVVNMPSVVIEGVYATEPKFRPSNTFTEANELAEESSNTSS